MFTEKEVQFVRDAWASVGRKFVHEPRVTKLDDESSVLDFDWFSIVRYPVTFKDIGVDRVIRYDVHVWEEFTGYDGRPEIHEIELAGDIDSIQAAVIECLTSDAKARISREVFAVPFIRTLGEI